MTGGETIQSYNHQLARKESDSFPHGTEDDDNIDVVNDDDKDSGKHFLIMWLRGAIASYLNSTQKVFPH